MNKRYWRRQLILAYLRLPRPLVFRYEVTAAGDAGKRPPPAWLHEKIRQPSAICAKSGIPYFFTCHTCLASPPAVLIVSKKSPGCEKPQGFKQKGKKQKTQTSKTLKLWKQQQFRPTQQTYRKPQSPSLSFSRATTTLARISTSRASPNSLILSAVKVFSTR